MCRIKYSVIASLVTFLIGIALAGVSVWLCEPVMQPPLCTFDPVELRKQMTSWQVLLSFEKRDLNKLDGESKRVLRTTIESVTGKVDDPEIFHPRMFRLLLNTAGEPRYILLEDYSSLMNPGNSEIRLHVFDTEGRILNTQEFSLWRTPLITGVRVSKVHGYRDEVLVIETISDLRGHTDREFYTLVGNEMRLNNVDKGDH